MRPDNFDLSVAADAASGASGSFASAGTSRSQTRFITDAMSRVPLVIATTASYCGMTMQNWPCAPSPR